MTVDDSSDSDDDEAIEHGHSHAQPAQASIKQLAMSAAAVAYPALLAVYALPHPYNLPLWLAGFCGVYIGSLSTHRK